MSIGDAATATGLAADTIRYYEKIGLLAKPPRSAGNYRSYGPSDVRKLGFVRRARELGFRVEQVRELLGLASVRERDCCRVDELTEEHLVSIDRKIRDLQALRRELASLLESCKGGTVNDCKILEALVPVEVAPEVTQQEQHARRQRCCARPPT